MFVTALKLTYTAMTNKIHYYCPINNLRNNTIFTLMFEELTTHSKRLNCGQGTIGFLHSACWFVRYSVIMESRVIWDSPIPGMHPVVTVEEFFRSGDELITLHWSHEICFCKERQLVLPVADPCTFLK